MRIYKFLIGFTLGALGVTGLAWAALPPGADSAATQEARFREDKLSDEQLKKSEELTTPVIEDRAQPAPSEAVSGATMKIPVKEVHFLGNYSIPNAELEPLVRELVGRDATLDEIQAAVSRVKKYYREKGYVATYAYVPPQEVKDGIVSIDVIEGRLGELRVEGAKFYNNQWLRQQFSIKSGEVLTYDAIRKDLNRVNRLSDIRTKLVLEAGKQVGTADAVVSVEDSYPIHLSADLNNSGTKNTGLYRFGTNARNNNLTGHSDVLTMSTQLSSGTGAVGAGYELPLLETQTRAGYQVSYADVDIGGDFRALKAKGEATTQSFYLTHPLWEGPSLSVRGTAGFDFKRVRNELLGLPSGKDDLRIARFEATADHEGVGNKTLLSGGLYTGIPKAFGGMDGVDPNASRINTGNDFFAARAQGVHFRKIAENYLLSIRGSTQFTGDKLPSSEQFRLGGARSVRGYSESDSLADYGSQISAEFFFPVGVIPADWHLPTGELMQKAVQGFVFADGGWGGLHSPAAGEDQYKTLAGVGFGARVHLGNQFYARAEWGFPVADEPADKRDKAFYFTISYEFF